MNKHFIAQKQMLFLRSYITLTPELPPQRARPSCQCPANRNKVGCQQQNALTLVFATYKQCSNCAGQDVFRKKDIKTEPSRLAAAGSQAAGAARDAAGRLSLLGVLLLRYFTNTPEIVASLAFSVDLNKLVSSKAKCPVRVSQQIRFLQLVVIGNRSK